MIESLIVIIVYSVLLFVLIRDIIREGDWFYWFMSFVVGFLLMGHISILIDKLIN